MGTHKAYSTYLSDSQWVAVAPFFQGMRNRQWPKRELLNAILYKIDKGCKLRNLSHDFPPLQTLYSFFRRAKMSDLWDDILHYFVEITKQIENRSPSPSYGIKDSQSVKTVCTNEECDIDGGKKSRAENDI